MRRIGVTLGLMLVGACQQTGDGRDAAAAERRVVVGTLTGDPVAGARVFVQCKACHTIGADAPDTDGPNLYDVVDGPVHVNRWGIGARDHERQPRAFSRRRGGDA